MIHVCNLPHFRTSEISPARGRIPSGYLCKLTPHSSRHILRRMRIRKKRAGILHDLSDMESSARVSPVLYDARGERARQAALRDPPVVWTSGVGKGQTRWSVGASDSLVDVCCRVGWRLIFSGHT